MQNPQHRDPYSKNRGSPQPSYHSKLARSKPKHNQKMQNNVDESRLINRWFFHNSAPTKFKLICSRSNELIRRSGIYSQHLRILSAATWVDLNMLRRHSNSKLNRRMRTNDCPRASRMRI